MYRLKNCQFPEKKWLGHFRRPSIITTRGLLLVCIGCFFGCRDTNQQSTIEIKNFSNQPIAVQQITGFKLKSSEIKLGPAVINTIKTDTQSFPEDFAIHWKYDSGAGSSGWQKSKISIAAIPIKQRTSKIVLEFTGDRRWVARFE